MSFKIGQKVVCLISDWPSPNGEETPTKDGIYTIRELVYGPCGLSLRLEEIINIPHLYSRGLMECSFIAQYFRLIDYSFGEMVAESITTECEKETVKEVIELHQ
jgi:hypothetical protein